jgi:3-methyl-2-oxobutanoate hydroxymethyltransferase
MPMGSYEASDELAVTMAQRLIKETGCQAVKLEAGGVSVQRARAIVQAGIPVMGHLGLTPQTATALGGYKAQGKSARAAIQMHEDAMALERAGCFAVVFEAVPAEIAATIAERLEIITIGIGAGAATRGGSFPGPEHVYAIDDEELADFRRHVDDRALASAKAWEWEPLS